MQFRAVIMAMGSLIGAALPTIRVHYLPRVIQEHAARHPVNRIKVLDHSS